MPGQGNSAYLSPLHAAIKIFTAAHYSNNQQPRKRMERKKVLIVDDDPVVRKVYGDVLQRNGFDVVTAGDGVSGIQELRIYRPDLLVLDLMMPKLDGVEVLKFIQATSEFKNLPVFLLSNRYAGDLTDHASRFSVCAALLKMQCTPAQLVAKLKEFFDRGCVPKGSSELLVAHRSLKPADSNTLNPSSTAGYQP